MTTLDGILLLLLLAALGGWGASALWLWQRSVTATRRGRLAVRRAKAAEALVAQAADMKLGAPLTADEQRAAWAAALTWQRDAAALLATRRNGHSTRAIHDTVAVG